MQATSLQSSWKIAFFVSMTLLAACKVTTEDIEHWKGTVKGPGKIVAVMLADKYPIELRTQAALALVDMERPDRDGTADLQQALQRLDETTRNDIIRGMVEGLEAQMKQADPSKAENGGPAPRQVRAKDAAFLLITHAPSDVKARLTVDVVNWYVEDFNGRSLAGNYSAEQVVRALGSPAAKVLVKGLKARAPQQALVKMAQLIGQIADPDARKEAGTRVIAIEQEMSSKDFLDWIKQTLRAQAAAQNPPVKLDEKKLDVAATKNRDSFVNDGVIPAMKWLADEPLVKQRLLALARTPGNDPMKRVHALQALEGKVDKSDLQPILAMALDNANPPNVRDYAFDRVGDIKAPEAMPQLWPLVSSTGDARLRWRAGELVLAIGGPAVVSEFFARLPKESGEFPAEELEGYALRLGQMNPLPNDAMRQMLGSGNWWERVVAIRYLERKGTEDDAKKLQALKNDDTHTKGPRWGTLKTVGKVAEEAYDNAKQRLAVHGA
jgi:hypothetical protein